jgi:hypothetical protein
MTRRVFNIITDESGQPLVGVPVRIQLNVPTFVAGEQKEIAAWSIETKTDANGRWEVELEPNDLMSDPNSYYKVIEYSHKRRKANEYAIRVPSTGYTEPIHITNLLITPPPVTPPNEAVTGIASDNNALLKGDVRLLAGAGIQLQQDNSAKTITIVNTGGGSGSGADEKVKVFKDGTQIGTVARRLDFRGTGTVDFTVTEDAANDQFDIAANIKSGVITDTHIAANANIAKSKISPSGQWTKAELPSDTVYTADNQELSNKTLINPAIKDVDATPVANRQLRVVDGEIVATDTTGVEGRYIRDTSIKGTGTLVTLLNADKVDGLEGADLEKVINKGVANGYAPLDANAKLPLTHLPSHTHSPSQITPQGSGSGLDADTVDGQHASAFAPANHTHTRSQITDFAHAATHQAGGSDPITGNLDANARVTVKQSGTVVGTRRAINFIAGSNISLSISDDAANEEVDVTISAAGGGSSSHNLLDGVVHPDTEATTVQRGMLIVGKLSGALVKWGGLPLGSVGRFLKSNGTDAVWDVIQASDLPSHTHTKSQITDLEQITVTPTANAIPKADASGKIALGWIPQGSGSNLDADKLDGLDSTAFERVSNKGVANGYAPLDASAKVPIAHLPSHTHQASEVDMPVTERTASYTLQLTDKNSFIKMNSTTDVTVTIPTNASVAFPIGTKIAIMKYGTGNVTIVGATGVTLRDPNSQATITTQYDVRVIVKIGTNEWVVV